MRFFRFLLFLLSFSIQAQTLKVIDIETGNPISNLYVYCDEASAISNINGEVLMEDLIKCKDLNFQHPSYSFKSYSLEQVKSKNYTVYLETSNVSLTPVTLEFNKWEQKQSEIPITISNIPKKEIEFGNPQTTADLLNQSGKVFIQKSQLGGGSPMIRGFSTSRVLLVVDGVRMNTAIFREGNVQNVISLDANAIEHTDIIFGPGSVIYGSDAIGGVMDFKTLIPQYSFSDKPSIALSYMGRYTSGNSEKTGHIHFNLSNSKLASITSFTYSDYDDQIMGSFGPDDYLRNHFQKRIADKDSTLVNSNPLLQKGTGFSQFNFMEKLRYRLNKDSELFYGFHYSSSSNVPRFDRLTEYSGTDTLKSAEWYYGPQVWMMHNLKYSLNRSNKAFDKFKTTLAYQQFEESRNDRKMFSNNLRSRTEMVNALSASLDFEKELRADMDFFYGAEYVYNLVNSTGLKTNILTGTESPTSTRYPDGSTWQYSSLYGAYRYNINSKLTLNTGLRFNYVKLRGIIDTTFFPFTFNTIDNDFVALNGSIGLSQLFNNNWQINLNLSNGFRAPNIDDVSKIFDSGEGKVVIPNPDLKPELLYSLDLGIIKKHKDIFQLELGGYFSYLKNALVRSDFTLNGLDSIVYDDELSQVQALQNLSSATVYGLQGAFKMKLMPKLMLRTNLHYNYGETNDGKPLRHVSPLFGSTHLVYTYNKMILDLFSNYNGKISYDRLADSERDKPNLYALDTEGNPYSPAWTTFNLKVELELSQKLKLQLGLDNITDVRYRPYSSGIAAMGRSVSLTIRGQI